MRTLTKNFLFVILILLTISALFALFSGPFESVERISLSQLAKDISGERVEKIVVSGTKLTISYADGSTKESTKEPQAVLPETLLQLGVAQDKLARVDIEPREESGFGALVGPLALVLLPLLIFFLFFWMMFRQARSGIGQAFDFTKARARLFGAEGQLKQKVNFKDVAGLKEAKEEVQEVVDFLKYPKKYLQMGAKIPRGVLLVGLPGTGKTLLAKAVASEAGVPFFSASGSEFIEMFVGVGSSRVRDLFQTAKKAGRSIIFIDELDAIGRTRGFGFGGGHDEREQTLNQILVEMDGFDRDDTQIVIAATNRPDVLDPALLRPGRFDRRIILDLPDVNDRDAILKIHAEGKPLAEDVRLREIAERTPGFSGADLANLMNEAAILAARRNKQQISQAELFESIDKVLLGPERKSHVLSKKEKKITAYHEAGHALVATSLKNVDPVRKISIISRGRAGGYTLKLPAEDKHLKSRAEFVDELAVLLGGYTAELLVFLDITTGPSNDLEKASEIARSIVKDFGMSERVGAVTFGEKEYMPFWGRDVESGKNYSEATALQIDREVAQLIESARKTAGKILSQKRKTLDKIAQVLIEKETIEREEFEQLVGKPVKSLPRKRGM
ncbi:MAG: cell division protein FtsH [Candidatus Wildermuthbacteria bacterium RIFCSPLOWO2_02_FULL_47_9c]|uniref:ATP-dependent zinc metalloprotease FtsH n=2 Tax=Parcubacteria group TaxID=1794811 RepID=A0A1G2RV24_9BACT|nr:MAG: ATP-dependent zinc metalloprotease FtsH [Parcubacteria group bacterium GW2011_GWB1_49_12]KKW08569.1 MAG: ATP-dependent zinc metalloprotease FtsH [Parcubacteria group bacterium GW2011_GWA1_49_26]KKW14048.1 MAG: ATP-dependent zinc metalloprotease FtsH [Parcubacteria group bacterium GW2011_GWA2_50_10]OHA61287.1 MAG: cell division protein FtsH [Candidatus Wildermuthbacteria bacterium GWA1_49_26]OHA65444.1 MAG: cell division protein FtsH [Candidatus Wildermuthbacteria bacterium RIFCSPHIGHO2_